jgi:16S rRNA (cytosine1402-N4)-methyltransferase
MMTEPHFDHIPVLLTDVLTGLNPSQGLTYVDATLGGAGHASALLAQCPQITLIGCDRDPQAIAAAKTRLPNTVKLLHTPFSGLVQHLPPGSITGGILLDLGVSSPQLDQADRGFSFRQNGPLDMRMSQTGPTAADLLMTASEGQLTEWFKQFGEERLAKPIAQAIKQSTTPFTTTAQLAQLVGQQYARFGIYEKHHHPATRVFQALRIAVNAELTELQKVLNDLPLLLAPGARVAIISFHSLEDRMVKQWMVQQAAKCVCPPRLPVCQCGKQPTLRFISRKPVVASAEAQAQNPRARSAKLRLAEWL